MLPTTHNIPNLYMYGACMLDQETVMVLHVHINGRE